MSLPAIPAPLWFLAAILPLGASQIVRLQQSDPAAWVFWDYAGRLGALAVLGAIPSARKVAFGREHLRISLGEAAAWVLGIILVDHYLCGWIRRTINSALPQQYLAVTLNCTARWSFSTLYSALRLWPTAKKLCSGAVRVARSKDTLRTTGS